MYKDTEKSGQDILCNKQMVKHKFYQSDTGEACLKIENLKM